MSAAACCTAACTALSSAACCPSAAAAPAVGALPHAGRLRAGLASPLLGSPVLSQVLRGRAAAAALTRAHCSASLSLSCVGGGRLASASLARCSVWTLSVLALRRAGEGARQQPRTTALCVRPRGSA